MKGVYGKVLNIDLTTRQVATEKIPDQVYQTLIGGKGLCTYLLARKNKPRVDPLSADNHLIIGLGPAVNTRIWGSSRYGIFTLSPQTGIYAHSYSGGAVAEFMGKSGYDAFVLSGVADQPTVLEISDRGVTFHDARGLWGLDTYQSQDAIKAMVGTQAGVISIGPAGENRVRFALVANNRWRCAGRGGVGAVMGSKNIKGLAFHGSTPKTVAEPAVLQELWDEIKGQRNTSPVMTGLKKNGTPALVGVINSIGAFPSRYWSAGRMEGYEAVTADSLHKRCAVRPHACAKCLMACGRLTTVKHGRHQGLTVEGPEFETIYSFGGLCDIREIEEIVYLNDVCDRLGLDTISAGNLAAFAIEASRRHKIPEQYAYGDATAIADLLTDTAHRRGQGAVLARGIRHAARQWGLEEVAVHVNGMEPSGYDPRVLKGMGLAYATSDRGACHLRSTVFKAALIGEIGAGQIEGQAEQVIDYEDRLTLQDALIVCRFYRDILLWDGLGKLIHGTLGLKLDREGMRQIAANIRNATRRFNMREGRTRAHDTLPKRFFDEPVGGDRKITRGELDTMLDRYYGLRGWDENGVPPEAATPESA